VQVRLANPRGFCAGVDRAIEIVERALEIHGPPVYVLHEIVHNRRVLEDLSSRGARFVETLDDVPEGAITIFSAHGVAEDVVETSQRRRLQVIDATCPLVTKVHVQAQRYCAEGRAVLLIGHPGHPEVEGTRGRVDGKVTVISSAAEVADLVVDDPERLAYVTQTTLSIDDTREVIQALERRFPSIRGPELKDICYATQNRQNAVRELSRDIDVLIVVGSQNSSNSNRLAELGERSGVRSYLVDDAAQIQAGWLAGARSIGVTAGASAPEVLVEEIIDAFRARFDVSVESVVTKEERIAFNVPRELRETNAP
jgi:4-hydroxy-3-methylbut-2-enyl diphosphate reductase